MIVEAEARDVTQYTTQYELLRTQVTGAARRIACAKEPAQTRGTGLALLLRGGMPAWLRAVDAVVRASRAPQPLATPDAGAPATPGGAALSIAGLMSATIPRHDITTLLASLVLSTRPLADVSPPEENRRWQ